MWGHATRRGKTLADCSVTMVSSLFSPIGAYVIATINPIQLPTARLPNMASTGLCQKWLVMGPRYFRPLNFVMTHKPTKSFQ